MSDHDTSLEWDTSDRDVSFAIFWDRCGETQELESFPQSFKHWELGEPLDGDVQLAVIRKVEDLFAKQVVRTELRAIERNLVSHCSLRAAGGSIADYKPGPRN